MSHSVSYLVTKQSLSALLKQPIVHIFALLFVSLVLMSAYLGWSATSTVNAIYQDAVVYLQSTGGAIPSNPVTQQSSLGLLRNMTIYISLIGALASIVVGYQLIATDRKSGVVPLIGTRIGQSLSYLLGKVSALAVVLGAIILISTVIAVITLALLPAIQVSTSQWVKLAEFFACAYLYLLFFGFVSIASSATSRVESVALLIPVTLWLTFTFVFPELTSSIHSTAAINPISSLVAVPDSAFFHFTSALLGPISLTESFKTLGAYFLEYQVSGEAFPRGALLSLVGLTIASGCVAAFGVLTLKLEKGEFDV
jgi:ABC-type transport system involved in multi-copper enzyme maturation permease subunit